MPNDKFFPLGLSEAGRPTPRPLAIVALKDDWPLLYWVAVLILYGVLFVALRSWAAGWATFDMFSLWFPAAGLRFAFLWFIGPWIAPAAAISELLASLCSGTIDISERPLLGVIGTVAPCLVYGLVIRLIDRERRASEAGSFNPLPFATAAVIGPLLAGLGGLAPLLVGDERGSGLEYRELFANLLVFTLGDLLGIVLLAPPLLTLARFLIQREPIRFPTVSAIRWLEMFVLLALAWCLVWTMYQFRYGLVLAPVLVATCFAALRSGRPVAWTAILLSSLIVLPLSGSNAGEIERIEAHMLLTCIAAGGYLIGSYSETQARALREIRRRDRLLLQAERLKTLRAMSLGVIHEVSQPLSTIALEASSLSQATAEGTPDRGELQDIADRISRKVRDLSDLVKRLRNFGEVGADERSLVQPRSLLNDVLELARPEADRRRTHFKLSVATDRLISVRDVEVRQALLNLVRNAVAASTGPQSTVWLGCALDGDDVAFTIENSFDPAGQSEAGMRIGLLIARTIAGIHGGDIRFDYPRSDRIRCVFRIPVAKSD